MASVREIETATLQPRGIEAYRRPSLRVGIVDVDSREASRMQVVLGLRNHQVIFSPDYQVLPIIFENNLDALIIGREITEMNPNNRITSIREWAPSLPIIFVDNTYDEDRCARVLDEGADDYLVQDRFSESVLTARIEVLVRRRSWKEDPASHTMNSIFENGGLTINFLQRTITLDSQEIHLTPTEYKLLKTLARNLGRTVLHEDLRREALGDELLYDQHILLVNITRLRHKLGENSRESRFIVTRPGHGYMMPDLNQKNTEPNIREVSSNPSATDDEELELAYLELNPLGEAIEALPQIIIDKNNKKLAIDGRVVRFGGKVGWTVFTFILYSREKGVSHSDIYEETKRKVNSWSLGANLIGYLRTKLEVNPREPKVIITLGENRHARYYIRGVIREGVVEEAVPLPEVQSGGIFESGA